MAEEREPNNGGEGASGNNTPPRLSPQTNAYALLGVVRHLVLSRPRTRLPLTSNRGLSISCLLSMGLSGENPYTHIREFEDVCATCRDGRTSNETIHLNLFPFSLKDRAKVWLNSLPPNSITTWLDLQAEFLTKFFPLHRTQALQKKISNFAQKPNESFLSSLGAFQGTLESMSTSWL